MNNFEVRNLTPKTNLEVTKDCFCEHYLHEISSHYREGIKEKKLLKGTKVTFEKTWNNMFGLYITVCYNNQTYDILPENLKEIY